MKKIYTLVCVAFAGLAFGQFNQSMMDRNAQFTSKEAKNTSTEINEKAIGVTFYTNNFSTPADWTLDNDGQVAPEFGWSIDATADGWWSTAGITSASGGNFAELGNGNTLPSSTAAGNMAIGVTYTMTTASPISLGSYGQNVTLGFQQFGAHWYDVQEFMISEDGINFISIGDNSEIAQLTSTSGAQYANPMNMSINLAPYLSASATQVWIRFSWTSEYPSDTQPTAWLTYGWYIDDVTLTSNADNDIDVIDYVANTAGLFYYQVPLSQAAPIDFVAVVTKGTNDVTNAKYEITMNPGAVVASSPTFNLTSTIFDTVVASVTPTALGAYTVTSAFVQDSIDDIPSNNVIPAVNFTVTDYIYARDNGIANSYVSNGGDGFEYGNFFDIWSDIECWGMNVRLASGTPVGEEFKIILFEVDPTSGDFVNIAESPSYYVTSSMLNAQKTYTFGFPVNMSANMTYIAAVSSPSGGIRISRAGKSDPQTTFLYDYAASDWFYTTNTPWIRLNFDPSLGLEENNGSLAISSVYPNPTTGNSAVTFSLTNTQNVNVTVYDVAGQLVYSNEMGNLTEGTHKLDINSAAFNAGVYMVNIASNDGVVTKKLIKK